MSSTAQLTDKQSTKKPRRRRGWVRALKIALVIFVVMVIGLVGIPIVSPSAGAAIADGLRAIIGPEAVASIESVSFKIQDVFNQARYQVSGGQAQVTWADPASDGSANTAPPTPPATTKAAPAQPAPSTTSQTTGNQPPAGNSSTMTQSLPTQSLPTQSLPVLNVLNAPSPANLDWQSFGPTGASNQPIMARASVNPDPSRAYALAALVRIDLTQTILNVVPGTVEPVAAKGTSAFPRPGKIPAADQASGNLLAAFNGGFKAVHGGYGMMIESGVTILPPQDNLATLALYQDGSVQIGAWGRDITPTVDLIAYRQNCPLLVDEGQINPHVNDENRKEWGYTIKNLDTTWRSGVGLSQDGQFLIYAAGGSLTTESLARALQQAGAYYAMQLDINGFYTRFVTYQPVTNPKANAFPVIAHKLLNEMPTSATQFLTPYDRDFFYLLARPTTG